MQNSSQTPPISCPSIWTLETSILHYKSFALFINFHLTTSSPNFLLYSPGFMGKRLDLYSDFQLKKCSKGEQPPQDYISLLPDDVLFFILSFLTYKEAAQTSLLSHRWFNLWMHFPVLLFDGPIFVYLDIKSMGEIQNFVNKVNRVLLCHKGQNLKEFRVTCELDKRYQKDIDRWLEFALTRKVQNLEFNFMSKGRYAISGSQSYVFPDRLLNFDSKISRGVLNSVSNRSRSLNFFDFKPLMSVSLKGVDVSEGAIEFFLLNCPFLERLEVVGSAELVNVVISDPSLVLKHLQIQSCHNLKTIRISNSSLVSLKISSVSDLILINVPMLVELFIKLQGPADVLRHILSQISCCHSQLEVLTLHACKTEDITQLSAVTHFTKLKRLAIQIAAWRDESLTKLISFIKACPNLEEFVLMLFWFKSERSRRSLRKVKRCQPLECLKVVEFLGYYGRVSDVELIMHLMKNAPALEKVIVDPRNPSSFTSHPISELQLARSIALQQFESLKESIPSHVELVVR